MLDETAVGTRPCAWANAPLRTFERSYADLAGRDGRLDARRPPCHADVAVDGERFFVL